MMRKYFTSIIWTNAILRIPYTRHTTNETMRSITACSPVSGRVKSLWLRFFGHLARTAAKEEWTVTVSFIATALKHLPIGGGPARWAPENYLAEDDP